MANMRSAAARTTYDVEWVAGMGAGLADKIARLLTSRAERGWLLHTIVSGQSGEVYGALVVFEKQGMA